MQSHKDATPPSETQRAERREHEVGVARERMLWRVWEDVRHGASVFHQRNVPLPVNRLKQFVHGLCLPFHLGRALLEDRAARRSYLKVCGLQALTVLALTLLFTGSGSKVVKSVEQVETLEERVQYEAAEARELARLEKTLALAKLSTQGRAVDEAKVRAAVEEAHRLTEKARKLRRLEREAAKKGRRTVKLVVYWAALFTALQVAQWIVIALSRDYHTAFSRKLSLRAGLVPEDEELTPRVRLNLPWMRTKLGRRLRGLVVFALGMPPIWALNLLLPGGKYLSSVLVTVWGAWWFLVFTAGKTARAWAEPDAREPWFLRGWNGLTARFALFRWALFGAYGSLLTTFSRPLFSPAATVERQPWTLSGLAVVRGLAVLPLLKCFLRPLVSVSAQYLLEQEGAPRGAAASPPGAASAPGAGAPPDGAPPPAPSAHSPAASPASPRSPDAAPTT